MNDQALKVYLAETKDKAADVLAQVHVGADVKTAIKDLLQICDNFQALFEQASNSTADSRLAKKKLEQSKAETRIVEKNLEEVKKAVMSMANEIKAISGEANAILKRHPDDADGASAKSILGSAQSMVKTIVSLSKAEQAAS